MPIELGIWRIDGGLHRVSPASLAQEARLEQLLEQDPSLLGQEPAQCLT